VFVPDSRNLILLAYCFEKHNHLDLCMEEMLIIQYTYKTTNLQ
jgi:hypothetical protein